VALVYFILAQTLAWVYLVSEFNVPLPRLFHTLGGGIMGFLVGYFASNFLIFAVGITPVSDIKEIKRITHQTSLSEMVSGEVLRTCNTVNELSIQWDKNVCRRVVNWLSSRQLKPEKEHLEKRIKPQSGVDNADE